MSQTDMKQMNVNRANLRAVTFSEDIDPYIVCVVANGVASKPTAAWQRPAGITEQPVYADDVNGRLVQEYLMKGIAGEALGADEQIGIFDTNGYLGKCPHGKPLVGVTRTSQSTVGNYVDLLMRIGHICDRSDEYTELDAATYDVVATDFQIRVAHTVTAAVAITLPTALLGVLTSLQILDSGQNAGTNNITITGEGGELIDGAASKVINTDGGSVVLTNDGVNWFSV